MILQEKYLDAFGGDLSYTSRVCDLIKKVVSSYYKLPITDYKTKSRKREIITLKHITVYFIKKTLPKITLTRIGYEFSNYDHATVIHALKSIQNLIDTDKMIMKDVEAINEKLEIENNKIMLTENLVKDYYFIDLDECSSIKFKQGKAILLVGYTKEEIDDFMELNKVYKDNDNKIIEAREHKKTNLFILDKLKNHEKI